MCLGTKGKLLIALPLRYPSVFKKTDLESDSSGTSLKRVVL